MPLVSPCAAAASAVASAVAAASAASAAAAAAAVAAAASAAAASAAAMLLVPEPSVGAVLVPDAGCTVVLTGRTSALRTMASIRCPFEGSEDWSA